MQHTQDAMFSRVTSRRRRDVLAGTAAAALVFTLWAAGGWMAGNAARALDTAQRGNAEAIAGAPNPSCAC